MVKKAKKTTSQPKGEVTKPKVEVKKTVPNTDVDEIRRKIEKLTYGQCSVLKIALDRRLAITRARQ